MVQVGESPQASQETCGWMDGKVGELVVKKPRYVRRIK